VTITPFPSATAISGIYDAFDDACISWHHWSPIEAMPNPPEPTPIIRGDCYDFGPPDDTRDFEETTSRLVLRTEGEAQGGLVSYWPRCQVREIQLVVSSYSFVGVSHGWVGLVVPNPEPRQPPIGIWISSRTALGSTSTKVISTRTGNGSQTTPTARILVEELGEAQEVVLGIRFSGEEVVASAGNIPTHGIEAIPATGFPYHFTVAYYVAPGSELTAEIEEVRVVPLAATSACVLPTTTPAP
jgi:hypothetical protein